MLFNNRVKMRAVLHDFGHMVQRVESIPVECIGERGLTRCANSKSLMAVKEQRAQEAGLHCGAAAPGLQQQTRGISKFAGVFAW